MVELSALSDVIILNNLKERFLKDIFYVRSRFIQQIRGEKFVVKNS